MVTWSTLTTHGLSVPRFAYAATLPEAEAFARGLSGASVCLKADTNRHKSPLGLVELDLAAGESLERAWHRLVANGARAEVAPPFLVQQMVPAGPELFAGVVREPAFGPLLVAGLGGRLVEAIGRRVLRLLPIAEDEARAMVAELGLETLGRPAATDAFAAALAAVSRLVEAEPDIDELDLNPIILGDSDATVVDLRVVMRAGTLTPRPAESNGVVDARVAIGHLIAPRAVAVIGASADRSKPGGRAYGYLATHAPRVRRYAVNPRGGELDEAAMIARIAELPDDVDAAVIATPAASVPGVVREIGDKGIPAAVVFASGFKEAGEPELERSVADAARAAGVRLCGVNCMGIIGDAPLTFTQALGASTSVRGGVSFVTQSGAIGGSLLVGAWAIGLGTARFISVGNETDLSLPDYLSFLVDDDATSTVGLFLEGVADGRRLRSALDRLRVAGKGVAVLRTGAAEVAAAAVRTHTGALAGSDDAYRQVFRETGAVAVDDLPELLAACQVLEWQPRAHGRSVAVLSTSGGGCSLVADELHRLGLDVPELEPEVQARLADVLPPYAPTRNPIDTTGDIAADPAMLGRLIAPVLASGRVDAVLIAVSALFGPAADSVARSVVEVARTAEKPIVVGWMLPEAAVEEQFRALRSERIPVFDSIGLACTAVAALAARGGGTQPTATSRWTT